MDTIWLIGCGKMGNAMLKGWIKSKVAKKIIVVEPEDIRLKKYKDNSVEVIFVKEISRLKEFGNTNVVVLAVKPQIIDKILKEINKLYSKFDFLISIAAGIKLKYYEKILVNKIPLIRAMPNTPAAVGMGITAIVKNKLCDYENVNMSKILFGKIGEVIELDNENLMDAVTAISGSGPAYFFYMAEALINAGEKIGLSKKLSYKLASVTLRGSGSLENLSNDTLSELRKSVTSPGGTTEAGLDILIKNNRLFKLIEETVEAAKKRSLKLGKK